MSRIFSSIVCFVLAITGDQTFAQQKNLDFYLKQGSYNSPLLKDFLFQMESNKIDSQKIRAGYLPQVNGSSAGTYAPRINGWGYDEVITNLHSYNALITVSKQFAGQKNLNNQYLVLQLQNLGLLNQRKISEQDLKKSITQQYILVYGDLQQIHFNSEMLSLLKDEETILKRLTEKSVYKQTDFLAFLVTTSQQELLIKQLQMQYFNDFSTLNYLCGIYDTSYTELAAPDFASVIIPSLDETVFYRQYQIDSLRLKAENEQIDFGYKPKFNIYADGGYNTSFLTTPYKNFGASAGFALTIPIYDGRQRRLLHQKNLIQHQSRRSYQQFFETQYYQQVAQLQQQMKYTDELISAAETQIKYAEGLITANRRQMITGDVRIADYIIAIGNFLNAKNTITQNMINRFQIINQINYWNRK